MKRMERIPAESRILYALPCFCCTYSSAERCVRKSDKCDLYYLTGKLEANYEAWLPGVMNV
ncbi:MAG: hypothetical protein QHH19_07200 [Candidatus Thermoplasmatota archaeon]|nr:hypothetical protein [Candidatus Thermoplasmatota archaeon]